MSGRFLPALLVSAAAAAASVAAQRGADPDAPANFVKVNAPVVALVHARVVDGTGAPVRQDQTIVIRNGTIESVGDSGRSAAPAGATVVDLTNKTVIPGLVMVHEHLFYPTGPGVYGQLGKSFTRLYLAGGVTTMRTGGNLNGVMDFNLKRLIDDGALPGPAMDATAPYLNGQSSIVQEYALKDAADARRQVAYWANVGATSFKAYMQITRAELAAAIDEVHKRGLKITGHLCSVTYGEAADLGIDNLEHGFMAATDFVPDKKPDECPAAGLVQKSITTLDADGVSFTALVKKLVDKRVALTSTMTVFEPRVPGRPLPPGLDVLLPELRAQFEANYARAAKNQDASLKTHLRNGMALERAFARAGGLLIAGTDPTGGGGVIPGYANQRQLELLVEEGFTPIEAIQIGTLNGAKYLKRDARVGSIAAGKQADLVVVRGDPSTTIADVRNVETVFKAGVGFDPGKLVDSVRGRVGLW